VAGIADFHSRVSEQCVHFVGGKIQGQIPAHNVCKFCNHSSFLERREALLNKSHRIESNMIFSSIFQSMEFLVGNFKNLADQILTMNPNGIPDEFNVLELATTVEFFCKIIHNQELGKLMKSDRSLVISTIGEKVYFYHVLETFLLPPLSVHDI